MEMEQCWRCKRMFPEIPDGCCGTCADEISAEVWRELRAGDRRAERHGARGGSVGPGLALLAALVFILLLAAL